MRHANVTPAMGRWIIGILLVALGVRALVPAGFMPAADRPFSFQICPDGFPAQLLTPATPADGGHAHHGAHHHPGAAQQSDDTQPGTGSHESSSVRAEHCVFAVAASAGPVPHGFLLGAAPEAHGSLLLEPASPVLSTQRFRVPQSRAPPIFS